MARNNPAWIIWKKNNNFIQVFSHDIFPCALVLILKVKIIQKLKYFFYYHCKYWCFRNTSFVKCKLLFRHTFCVTFDKDEYSNMIVSPFLRHILWIISYFAEKTQPGLSNPEYLKRFIRQLSDSTMSHCLN